MSDDLSFRPATAGDAAALAARIHEVSAGVTELLLRGILPGISVCDVLTMVLRDASSHYSHKNCVLAEYQGRMAGLLFAYAAEEQAIPPLMERMLPTKRLEPVRELLTLCHPGSLYINTLWVDGALRGLGVAHALMEYARLWAEDAGHSSISLFAWRDNERAVSFYRKQGFIPVREIAAQGGLREQHDRGDLYILKLVDTHA